MQHAIPDAQAELRAVWDDASRLREAQTEATAEAAAAGMQNTCENSM